MHLKKQGEVNLTKALTYNSNWARHKSMFSQLGVDLKQVCHLWRKNAAVESSESGVARDQTEKSGHWNQKDAIDMHYLNQALPLAQARHSAGHSENGG